MGKVLTNQHGSTERTGYDARFHGIVVPLITPINRDETLDEKGLRRLIQHVLKGGVHGILIMGTSGEFPRFTLEEWTKALEVACDENAGRATLYAGVSDTGSTRVIRRIKTAKSIGVDAVAVTPPYYYPLSDQQEILMFYREVERASDLPMIIYNIPSFVLTRIEEDTWRQLAKLPLVIGVKDSSGDHDSLRFLTSLGTQMPDFAVFIGSQSLYVEGLLMGAKGVVPSLGNVAPALCVTLYHACLMREEARINELFRSVRDLDTLNSISPSALTSIAWKKKALEFMGICQGHMTQPFWWPEEEVVPLIREKLRSHGLI